MEHELNILKSEIVEDEKQDIVGFIGELEDGNSDDDLMQEPLVEDKKQDTVGFIRELKDGNSDDDLMQEPLVEDEKQDTVGFIGELKDGNSDDDHMQEPFVHDIDIENPETLSDLDYKNSDKITKLGLDKKEVSYVGSPVQDAIMKRKLSDLNECDEEYMNQSYTDFDRKQIVAGEVIPASNLVEKETDEYSSEVRDTEHMENKKSKHRDLYLEHFEGMKERDDRLTGKMKQETDTDRKEYGYGSEYHDYESNESDVEDNLHKIKHKREHHVNMKQNEAFENLEIGHKTDVHTPLKQRKKRPIERGESLSGSQERELRFDAETKFDATTVVYTTAYEESYSKSDDNKKYNQHVSVKRGRIQKRMSDVSSRNLTGKQLENPEYTEKENILIPKFKSAQTELSVWNDQTKDNGRKPHVSMTRGSNYNNRLYNSQDALANRKARKNKICRTDSQKKGEVKKNRVSVDFSHL